MRRSEGVGTVFWGGDMEAGRRDGTIVRATDYGYGGGGSKCETRGVEGTYSTGADY